MGQQSNHWDQPFCKGLPPEEPFEDDEAKDYQKGGTDPLEWNVGYDHENVRGTDHTVRGLPNRPLEREQLRKTESETGDYDTDTLKRHPGPDETSVHWDTAPWGK